jgi:hypothetical protein
VPVSWPAGERFSHAGGVKPLSQSNVIGAVPPLATNVKEYGTFCMPAGSPTLLMASVAGALGGSASPPPPPPPQEAQTKTLSAASSAQIGTLMGLFSAEEDTARTAQMKENLGIIDVNLGCSPCIPSRGREQIAGASHLHQQLQRLSAMSACVTLDKTLRLDGRGGCNRRVDRLQPKQVAHQVDVLVHRDPHGV